MGTPCRMVRKLFFGNLRNAFATFLEKEGESSV